MDTPPPSTPNRLLQAGLTLFHTKGFNAAGVQEITARAGVPKGSFYNHFESKEAFGAQVCERFGARLLDSSPLLDHELSPEARIRGEFELRIKHLEADGYQRGCLLGNLSLEMGDHSDLIRASIAAAFDALITQIEHALLERDPALAAGAARRSAASIFQSWQGAILCARIAKSRAPLDLFLHSSLPLFFPPLTNESDHGSAT